MIGRLRAAPWLPQMLCPRRFDALGTCSPYEQEQVAYLSVKGTQRLQWSSAAWQAKAWQGSYAS